MIRPRFHPRFFSFIALVAILGASSIAQAEQPPAMSPPPPELKAGPAPRSKPQVIYRLPRDSNYAATLHSQAKTHGHPPPIASGSPPTLPPRAATNEAAVREQQQQQLPQQPKQREITPKANSSRSQRVKPSKFHSNQPQMRKHGSGKGRGPGASRGKGGKK